MKTKLLRVSGAALAASVVGTLPPAADAQITSNTAASGDQSTINPGADQLPDTQPEPERTDRVIVTGQLIAGASEDAPAPVEVYDLEALAIQGVRGRSKQSENSSFGLALACQHRVASPESW